MQIRPLTRADMLDAQRIRAISFHGTLDEEKAREHVAAMPEVDIARDWGCFTDDGTLTACIVNNDFEVHFDGHVVRMGGIGGVATLPEHRYSGAIKSIFAELLRDARANGEVFSSLYPFSHEFYRKVGYETSLPVMQYEFPTALVAGYRYEGPVRRLNPGDSVEPLKAIYDVFAARYNLMVLRTDKRHFIGNPFKHHAFTMLLGDIAYISYRLERTDGKEVFCLVDLAYTGAEGLRAILGYIARMTADFSCVRLALPADVPLHALVPRPYELKCAPHYGLMARVTNVPEALRLMKKPEGVSFTIEVTDNFLPENAGVYRVSDNRVEKTSDAPDITVDVRPLAGMLLGTLPLFEALCRADVQLHGNREALEKAFIRKPCYLTDHF